MVQTVSPVQSFWNILGILKIHEGSLMSIDIVQRYA